MAVEALNGDKCYLVEVIAFILKHFKDRLMEELRAKHKHFTPSTSPPPVSQIKVTDIDWVITVPAIWQAKGKQMMRQAAYLVRINTTIYCKVIYDLLCSHLCSLFMAYTMAADYSETCLSHHLYTPRPPLQRGHKPQQQTWAYHFICTATYIYNTAGSHASTIITLNNH